jgi:multicomponent Na+:H+ antiporter subunit E
LAGGYTFKGKLLLSIILFAFWVVLTATLALYNLVLGAVCAVFVAVLAVALLGRALDPLITPRVLLRLPLFALALGWQIIKANIDVARIILSPKLPIDPQMVEYSTYLRGDLPLTVFADAITLKPGTVAVDVGEGWLSIHCLCPYHADGLPGLESMVAWLFGVKRDG